MKKPIALFSLIAFVLSVILVSFSIEADAAEAINGTGTISLIKSPKSIEDIYKNSIRSNVSREKMAEILTHVDEQALSKYVANKMISATVIDNDSGAYVISYPYDIMKDDVLRNRLMRKARTEILKNYLEAGGTLSRDAFKNVNILYLEDGSFIVENIGEETYRDAIQRSFDYSFEKENGVFPNPQQAFTDSVFGGFEFDSRVILLANDILKDDILLNKDDVYSLFEVVSYKHRALRNDPAYRQYNIGKAYSLIGGTNGISVINPNDTFSYNANLRNVMNAKTFKYGSVIMGDKIKDELGGGLCGGSTGIFQGSIYNSSLSLAGRNHSQYYHSLYDSVIQGKKNKTPGLDIAYWTDGTDLKIKNISAYPVIMVSRLYKGVEYNFTLNYKGADNTLAEVSFIGQKGQCYSWNINGSPFKSCYRKMNP